MNIENEIFKRTTINFQKLEKYGFVKSENNYNYSKVFMNNFRADITINQNGEVSGKIFDLDMNDEYLNFRIKSQVGEFVNRIREEYENILKDIVKECCETKYFITEQANRITNLILEKYGDEPYFAWEKSPGFGVFRNPTNEKWYGLLYNIDINKIDKKKKGEVEALNLKIEPSKINNLITKSGYYHAYHMNKKYWLTIILDETLPDEEIIELIEESHSYTCSNKTTEWIIPANPKFYDIINCFNDTNTILWKQSNSNIHIGDKVYLYIASPYSAILYKCEVVEVNIPYEYADKNLSMKKVMKIKLLTKYDKDKYNFTKLNDYGIKAIRGPIHMPEKLSKEINQ